MDIARGWIGAPLPRGRCRGSGGSRCCDRVRNRWPWVGLWAATGRGVRLSEDWAQAMGAGNERPADQMMQDETGRLWTSLGQSPGLQMAWRRLPVFRSDMGRRSAVVSLIVAVPDGRANEAPNCLSARDQGGRSHRLAYSAIAKLL